MKQIRLLSFLIILFMMHTAFIVNMNDDNASVKESAKKEVLSLTNADSPIPYPSSELEFDLTIRLDEVGHVGGGRHVRPGTPLRLDTYLTNNGPDSAPGRTTTSTGYLVGWYLSLDNIITTSDIQIGSYSGNSLDAGETFHFWGDVLIPLDIEGGKYYWGAIVDYTELLDETNEFNNYAVGKQVVIR